MAATASNSRPANNVEEAVFTAKVCQFVEIAVDYGDYHSQSGCEY